MVKRKIVKSNHLLFEDIARIVNQGKRATLLLRGNSMLPFLRDGEDVIVLEKMKRAPLLGDIVLVKFPPKAYVLHRIVKMKGQSLTLMGDGNVNIYEYCNTSDIIATAVKIIKPNGSEYKCHTIFEGIKWRVWNILKPVRRYLLSIHRQLVGKK